jgi:hypothetical protein
MQYIKIDNDQWSDLGIVYKVIEYKTRIDSTAVDLVLEYNNGTCRRTVANHQIEWLEPKDF